MSPLIAGTAGDIGYALNIFLDGYSATGCTVTLEASPIAPNGCVTPVSVGPSPMTISSDGSTVTYLWTGTDFTIGGLWNVWVVIAPPGGDSFTRQFTIFVGDPAPAA